MIHMKCQDLFFLFFFLFFFEKKKKKIECHLLQILLAILRVKVKMFCQASLSNADYQKFTKQKEKKKPYL